MKKNITQSILSGFSTVIRFIMNASWKTLLVGGLVILFITYILIGGNGNSDYREFIVERTDITDSIRWLEQSDYTEKYI